VKAVGIHGDRTQNQRNQALRGFREGFYRVLVATDVAARGIHVEGIAHVVNFDLPQAPEDFIHRVGRTGRAGQRGTASTFMARHERSELRSIERALRTQLNRQEMPANLPADLAEHATEPISFAHARAERSSQPKPNHGSKSAAPYGHSRKTSIWQGKESKSRSRFSSSARA
jgi:ATP-dependent RNA helicase RhlE